MKRSIVYNFAVCFNSFRSILGLGLLIYININVLSYKTRYCPPFRSHPPFCQIILWNPLKY